MSVLSLRYYRVTVSVVSRLHGKIKTMLGDAIIKVSEKKNSNFRKKLNK